MRAVEFVLEILSYFARGGEGPPPGAPVAAGAEFERDLVVLCRHQRVGSLIHHCFESLVLPAPMSRTTIQALKADASEADVLRARRLRLVPKVADALETAGVSAVLVGPAAAALVSKLSETFPVERVDWLIPEREWAGAVAVVRELGFSRCYLQPRLAPRLAPRGASQPDDATGASRWRQESNEVLRYHQYYSPLHFRNADGDVVGLRFRMVDFGHPERVEPAWHRHRLVASAGRAVAVAGREDQLFERVAAFGVSGFTNLSVALAIGVLVGGPQAAPDWDYLRRRARDRGMYAALHHTVSHVAHMLQLGRVLEGLPRPAAWRRRFFDVRWRLSAPDYAGNAASAGGRLSYCLAECGGLASKVLLLRRSLIPRRAWVRSVYGRPGTWWLFAKFLHDVRRELPRRAIERESISRIPATVHTLPRRKEHKPVGP